MFCKSMKIEKKKSFFHPEKKKNHDEKFVQSADCTYHCFNREKIGGAKAKGNNRFVESSSW